MWAGLTNQETWHLPFFLLHMAGILNTEALSHHMDKPRPLVLLRFQLHCCCNRPHKVADVTSSPVLAAKLLHPNFLTSIDPGILNTMQKFEQECEVLSTTKHPCIVQYLGTAKDPATGRLVLLMELMDESLLERSMALLPYHIQLNLSTI